MLKQETAVLWKVNVDSKRGMKIRKDGSGLIRSAVLSSSSAMLCHSVSSFYLTPTFQRIRQNKIVSGLNSLSTTTWRRKGSEGIVPPFLTSEVGKKNVKIGPLQLNPLPPALYIYIYIRGWVGSRIDLPVVEERKISCSCPESNLRPTSARPVAYSAYRLGYPPNSLIHLWQIITAC
jgi:hypothetical protein